MLKDNFTPKPHLEQTSRSNLALALQLAGRGWYIFPCNADKKPRIKWKDMSTVDPVQIQSWWMAWPEALIGIYCQRSGFFAVDIDIKNGHDGTIAWDELVQKYGSGEVPFVGPAQYTPSGGAHLLFAWPEGMNIPNSAGALGDGLDLRSIGYICTGSSYHWLEDHGPDLELTQAPAWLLELIKKTNKKISTNPSVNNNGHHPTSTGDYWLQKALERATIGTRNATGFWLASQLRDNCIPEGEAEAILDQFAQSVPGDGYTSLEALASVRSAYSSPPRAPTHAVWADNGHKPAQDVAHDQESIPSQLGNLTDTANGDRLIKLHGKNIRWVAEWGWILWDGRRWLRDKNGLVMRLAKETARAIYHEAAQAGADQDAKSIASWAGKSLSRARLEAMLALAQSEIPTEPDNFDRNPLDLNVVNGTIDLEGGNLRKHDSNDLITKIAGGAYDPGAICPTWEAFLDRILGCDMELIGFIQRAAGYTLTGEVSEQALFFLYGTGANGKSTFLQALLAVMGEYGLQAAPQLLLLGDRHPTEIADLQGARMVATIEVEEGRRMAEVLVKQMTGGDRMKARFMRCDFFEFDPTFKIWLAANHKPVIKGTDYAIWRRIHLIPFEVTIPAAEQDPSLGAKLREELPGILAWMVRGAIDWQRNGLSVPEKVKQATAEYQAENDLVTQFIADCCLASPMAVVFAGELYAAYKNWAIENGVDQLSQFAFSRRMAEKNFIGRRVPGDGRKQYSGLGLVDHDHDPTL